ncbi:MAG: transcriptional repressor LexA [Candidatus Brocadiia bacterium]
MTEKLTERQREVFDFIRSRFRAESRPPTVREIADHFGFASPKAATDHLDALEKKGFILRRNRKARNIELPEEFAPQGIPVLGRIAAGSPTLAVENLSGALSLTDLFEANSSTFALQVQGDSMTGAGIFDGDYVIVQNDETVKDGMIAAVSLDDEATVKRIKFDQQKLRLQPENPDFDEIVVKKNGSEVQLYGPVVGVIRKL